MLSSDPALKCVVSGGQGENEDYPESEIMKKYLVERGISADRIIEENQSKNTSENLICSKKIIEDNGLSSNITVVTDGFHQTRAKMLAKGAGFTSVAQRSSATPWYLAFSYWVREWFGICRVIVFGY